MDAPVPHCDSSKPDDLFELLFEYDIERKWLAMLYSAAIDDSADRHRERVVISGAIIGDAPRWSRLNKKWRERLGADGIDYFKSSQCRNLRGQFFKYRDLAQYPPPLGRQKADAVEVDLDQIIRDSDLMAIGAIVPMELYNSLKQNPGSAAWISTDPYHWAVQAVWGECALAMKELGRNNIVSFSHDDSDNFHVLHSLYKQYKSKNPMHAKVMADFVPLADKTHASVQAADVAASIVFRYAEEWAALPTAHNLKRLRGNMYRLSFGTRMQRNTQWP